CLTFALTPAFRAVRSAQTARVIRRFHSPKRDLHRRRVDRATFATRVSAPEFVEGKFLAQPDLARYPMLDSDARPRAQYRESISTNCATKRANPIPGVDRRSSAAGISVPSDFGVAVESTFAICVRPLA